MQRNDSSKSLVSNGKRRPGQFDWHNEDCQVEIGKIYFDAAGRPHRNIWCATHGQWADESPTKVVWQFEDGTTIERIPK